MPGLSAKPPQKNPPAPPPRPSQREGAWLALLLAGFVLPLAGAAGWIYLRMERELGASEARQMQLRARALAALVERELDATKTLLVSIAARRRFRQVWQRRDYEELEYHLRDLLALEPALLFASVYEPDGTLRAILPEDPVLGQNFAYRDWYRGVLARRAPYVSEVYRTAAVPNPLVVAVSVPVLDEGGHLTGILMAPYTLDTLNRKFAALEAGGGEGQPLVLDHRGQIAAGRHLDTSAEPVSVPTAGLLPPALAGGEGHRELSLEESRHWLRILRLRQDAGEGPTGRGASAAKHEQVFVAWSPVPRLGWTVLYLRPASEARAAVAQVRTLGLTLGTYLLVIYLLTSTLAAALRHRHRRASRELARANKELAERSAALEAANAELESFTYSVSHDLRAPLRHMDGFSRILGEKLGPSLDADSRRHLERIREAAAQMNALVDDLLALSRVGRRRPQFRPVRLDAVVEEARAELDRAAPSAGRPGARVQWRIGPLPSVTADPALLKQVFLNLFSNAVKFSSGASRPVIEVGSYPLDGATAVFVRDNGAGFDPRYAHKLFGVFQRLHRDEEFPGTGVGLAIVARIVSKHGGRIWAEGEIGRGATFTFTLPPGGNGLGGGDSPGREPLPEANGAPVGAGAAVRPAAAGTETPDKERKG